MPSLEDAIGLAVRAHAGQVDKAGEPYILHVLRVMFLARAGRDDVVGTAAVLHDLCEDCGYTPDDLAVMGYPPEIVAALTALTRRPGQTYAEHLDLCCADALARHVKGADLVDHLVRHHERPCLSESQVERYCAALRQVQAFEERPAS